MCVYIYLIDALTRDEAVHFSLFVGRLVFACLQFSDDVMGGRRFVVGNWIASLRLFASCLRLRCRCLSFGWHKKPTHNNLLIKIINLKLLLIRINIPLSINLSGYTQPLHILFHLHLKQELF